VLSADFMFDKDALMLDSVLAPTTPARATQAAPASDLKHRVHEVLDVAGEGDFLSRVADLVILTLIAVNAVIVILESVESVRLVAGDVFQRIELFSVGVFSVEYVLRVWSCTVDPKFARPIRGRLKFMTSAIGLIDLAAILPFFLPAMGLDMRQARMVRLVRFLRIAKLARYASAFGTFHRILKARKEELVATFSWIFFMLLVASSLMYFTEGSIQPEHFSSIPASMWWGVATMTTLGYGDVIPVTAFGKLLASVVALIGMGMFALPAGILGSAFVEDIQAQKGERKHRCPNCGENVRPAA